MSNEANGWDRYDALLRDGGALKLAEYPEALMDLVDELARIFRCAKSMRAVVRAAREFSPDNYEAAVRGRRDFRIAMVAEREDHFWLTSGLRAILAMPDADDAALLARVRELAARAGEE